MTDLRTVLDRACAAVGLSAAGAGLVRAGENQIYRLPGRVIVRINKPGQGAVAAREVLLGRWLNDHGVRAVDPLDLVQPVLIDDHPVTFWHELAAHSPGTVRQVAHALKGLHSLEIPDSLAHQRLAPFVRLDERLEHAVWLPSDDRQWLQDRLTSLRRRWDERPTGLPEAIIHGDAWAGNVVDVQGVGVTLLDLERCSVGPPEWDLTSTACRLTSYSTLTAEAYADYCDAYGYDVTCWSGFELFRDVRELRVTCFAAYVAQDRPDVRANAQTRVDSLRGRNGPRPWSWEPLV